MTFQAGLFVDFEQFKIDIDFADFRKVKIGLTLDIHVYSLWTGHSYFTEFGQDVGP